MIMKINKNLIHLFQKKLSDWHIHENTRQHPWSDTKDPYKVWLSEIIMQQTRIEQGLPYYLRFIEKYPTIKDLAAAPDEEVFLLWEGLGYYNRCRNLLSTARYIAFEKDGIFPKEFDEIISLKGVGSYTASAIASFAYDLPYAVLDGNVFRLLARFFGIEKPIDNSQGKKKFQELADRLLIQTDSAMYNQAIMDFGATVCKPKNPDCENCPLNQHCVAFRLDLVKDLPIKEKKLKVKERHFQYFVLVNDKKIFIQKRTDKDIWQNLFQFYLIEDKYVFKNEMYKNSLQTHSKTLRKNIFKNKQRLTHQLIHSYFHIMELKEIPIDLENGLWVSFEELNNYPFPKTILDFIHKSDFVS